MNLLKSIGWVLLGLLVFFIVIPIAAVLLSVFGIIAAIMIIKILYDLELEDDT